MEFSLFLALVFFGKVSTNRIKSLNWDNNTVKFPVGTFCWYFLDVRSNFLFMRKKMLQKISKFTRDCHENKWTSCDLAQTYSETRKLIFSWVVLCHETV